MTYQCMQKTITFGPAARASQVERPDEVLYETGAKPDVIHRMVLDNLLAEFGITGRPEQMMMVAAHKNDLRAAQALGFKTGFVPRPMEHGPGADVDTAPEAWIDVTASDFEDLAAKART